ncbi:CehA/McbA family metallohydrolase [Nonomuraea sp. SYSU D8015]|uniref:CehA/McbA family metallohydrolase n=1 Tax=Nonomuraea sp. SYSU D8015 TaxID=2593644 RepID=UPI0016607AA9|nr:CehA/McbA family metallohydrolase [Nonomuraea sp. SYSU D8015]
MHAEAMLPEPVAGALEEYGGLLGEHGITWGEPELHYVKFFARRRVLPPELIDRFWKLVFKSVAARHPGEPADRIGARLSEADYDEVLRDTLAGELPGHLVALRVGPDGHTLQGTPRTVLLPSRPLRPVERAGSRRAREGLRGRGEERIPLLVDSSRDASCQVLVDGTERLLAPRGAWLVEVDRDSTIAVDGAQVLLETLLRPVPAARLRLVAGMPCRWSVMGADGGWFPPGTPHRHDYHGRPYFHGDDVVVEVPAGQPLTVTVARGMEYGEATRELTPDPGAEHLIRLTPERLYDAAARGWYGGDMHVHLNWAGDLVGVPADAAAAQHGEDLHVLNLLAGNVSGRRVYDREALEHWIDRDLPWSDVTHLARMGVEYRNDLLGHIYAFAPRAAPGRFHTGFDGDADWPPNADGLRELRGLGALVGYSHPFGPWITDDGPPKGVVSPVPRNCAARELVADAALGLVDSLDVLTHASIPATAAVYRRLIGAGNRLAVTAGTDAMISFTRSDNQSNPPGWARVYARVEGELTARSFAAAVRAGRTFATTGPWLELSVDGHGPGHVIHARRGDRVSVTARAVGPEVVAVRIRTADGVRAGAERLPGGAEPLTVTADLRADAPTYIMAEVLCDPHPRTMTTTGYALTSPVYVDVDGRRVARAEDVRWCLEWLDLLEDLIKQHARLASPYQFGDHVSLLEQARAVYRVRLDGSV